MRTAVVPEDANMEVFVSAPSSRFSNSMFPGGSVVRDVLNRFIQPQGLSSDDFYAIRNGRLCDLDDPLRHGAVYHLEPRLCGGKGGFGSMLRALGAQIEKTTNREACRDLSGRRLRDVNHEKEMAEWLKNQAEREAEKEQRRLERLQRKLSEPKHQFTDPEYQQQCHDLSERLEDSVIKGLQASSGGQVKADDGSAAKRPNSDQSEQPHKKKKKKKAAAAAAFWTGVDELLSSEDEESPSTSSSGCGAAAVTMTPQTEEAEPEQSSSSSSADRAPRPPEDQRPPQTSRDQAPRPPEDQRPPQTSRDQAPRSPEDQRPPQTSRDQAPRPPEDQKLVEASKPSEESSSWSLQQGRALDLSSVTAAAQLESLGLDVLKEELTSRGLKCGGTLTERAARLFSVRGLTPEQIDPALLAKPGKTKRK
ncbi:replication stress response regulator SDE2 isoform X2 [Siniperca chuatsi]|uniref:replication stress response regulator SDE2 isoform X2 n=1 Tax=Siniperca chuatsi TaxID=119488 RepID=UPI001CE182CC|nr:replication stress response regulator SDE2 isoform X2 [Siniperca chuatsi]